jgi:hypothetical protein
MNFQLIGFTLVFLHVSLILLELHQCRAGVQMSEALWSSRMEQLRRNTVLLSNYCK